MLDSTKITLDPFLQLENKKKIKKSSIITGVMVIIQVYCEYKVCGKRSY